MANNLAAFNTEAWSKLLIANLDQINVMLPLVNRNYEGEIRNIGDTVQVHTLGSISMGPYAKNGTINYQDLAPTKEPMIISDAQYFAFKVDDVDVAQNDLSALQLYAQRAAVSLTDVIEAKLLSMYSGAHADNKINADSGLTSDNVYSQFVAMRTALTKKNVPVGGRWAVIDPDTTALLLEDTTHFINASDLGNSRVANATIDGQAPRPGFIGRIAGFDVYESNALPPGTATVGGTANTPVKYLVFGDHMAISYAAQIRNTENIRLETTFASAVRGLLLHDAKVFAEASKRLGYIRVPS